MSNLNEHTFRNMGRKVWADISDTLSEILLPGNDFTILFKHMFFQFPNLEKLSFQRNRITTVSPGAFHGLKLLKEIDLSKNKVNEIAHDTFRRLPSVSEINLSENTIEHLAYKLLRGLKKLRVIKLSYNRLKTFDCDVFDPMDFASTGGHPGKLSLRSQERIPWSLVPGPFGSD